MEKRKHVDDLQLGFRVERFKDFICLALGWKSEVMHVV